MLTNLFEMLIKFITSPRTVLTKEIVLDSMFPIVTFDRWIERKLNQMITCWLRNTRLVRISKL